MDTQWKLITILIGGNDLCDSCSGMEGVDLVAQFSQSLRNTLDFLRSESPRTLVNLVPILDVSQIYAVGSL